MRKILILLIGIVFLLTIAIIARERESATVVEEIIPSKLNASRDVETNVVATFEDFKITRFDTYDGEPGDVDFELHPELLQHEDTITTQALEGPNFAGKYTVVSWECGQGCFESIILHTGSGDVVATGLLSTFGLEYQPDSTLLIVNPHVYAEFIDSVPIHLRGTFSTDYYLFENEELNMIFKQNTNGTLSKGCPELPARARNVITDELRTFTSQCSIPTGWEFVVGGREPEPEPEVEPVVEEEENEDEEEV